MPPLSSPRWDFLAAVLLVLAMVVCYALCAGRLTVPIGGRPVTLLHLDDSYISLRYGLNLAAGHGLVANPGDTPVEGSTSFLWVLCLAALCAFDRDPPAAMVLCAGALHAAAAGLFFLFLRRRLNACRAAAGAAALLLALWTPAREQAFAGMEMPLVLFLFVLAAHLLTAPSRLARWAGAAAAGLLPLTRPDAALPAVLLVIAAASPGGPGVPAWRGKSRLWLVAAVLLPALALTLFRLAYFGDPLPNSYYLKMVDRPGRVETGLRFVFDFFRSFPLAWTAPLVVTAALADVRRGVGALAAGALLVPASVAWQGGDFDAGSRFFTLVWPMLAVACVSFGQLAGRRWGHAWERWIWVGVVALAACSPSLFALAPSRLLPAPQETAAENARAGFLLKAICDPDAVTADFWAGATPYCSGLRSIDMLGKTDRHVARVPAVRHRGAKPGHDKYDFAHSLEPRPDVVVGHLPAHLDPDALRTAMAETPAWYAFALLRDPSLLSDYELLDGAMSSRWHAIYVRQDTRRVHRDRLRDAEDAIFGGQPYLNRYDGFVDFSWDQGEVVRRAAGSALVGARAPQAARAVLRGALATDGAADGILYLAPGDDAVPRRLDAPASRYRAIELPLDLPAGETHLRLSFTPPAGGGQLLLRGWRLDPR
jgi:hypothetical protein